MAKALRTKKVSEVSFVLEKIHKNGGVLKYPKAFQCGNGSEFKSDVTKFLEKHNVDIRRTTTKYKHTDTAFVEAFNKQLAKQLFKPMDVQELQDPEKVSTIRVKNLNSFANKMNNKKSPMIDVKPKDIIKPDTQQTFVGLQDVLKTCLEDVLKTCIQDVFKMYSRRFQDMSSRRLQDVLETNKMFTGNICI